MTEAERRQRNWVELRAACTKQGTFERIADTVKEDVDRFSKLSPPERRNRLFKYERTSPSVIYVAEVNEDGEWIKDRPGINIEGGTKIRVWQNERCHFTVKQEWNEKSLDCDLKIDGECYSVWQISQKAIGDLMFGYD